MKNFVNGRKTVFSYLEKHIKPTDKIIWLHAASLGEYEQGVPLLKVLKEAHPDYKFLVTFFSPSGYEVKKNNDLSDYTTYLPLDTPTQADRFVKITQPKLAIFVKYEIWPNYLFSLKHQNIPTLLVSGNFRANQIYFHSSAHFLKKALHTFNHIFVQNSSSKAVLNQAGFNAVSISGDTRFDRVTAQLQIDNHLDFMEVFKRNRLCIVFGSTWPEDEDLFLNYINESPPDIKFVIAPHQIKTEKIKSLSTRIRKKTILYSEITQKADLSNFQVLIVNTVGLLAQIYAYGNIAYVGGAAGNTGLHNILEPATFGMPIVIGKNHQKFPEAAALKKEKGLFVARTPEECSTLLNRLVQNSDFREKIGENAKDYVLNHKGATKKIMAFIEGLNL